MLLKLIRDSGNPEMTLRVTYETREGEKKAVIRKLTFQNRKPEYFENLGIRKAVLLSRYADLMKNWIIYERDKLGYPISPVSLEAASKPGIEPFVTWPGLNQWERMSVELRVSKFYEEKIEKFIEHFHYEMKVLNDENLGQELEIMEELLRH